MGGLPARDYSWPPFPKGHELRLEHGANSERHIAPVADAIAAELDVIAPWLNRPAFAPGRAAWIRVEAQLALLQKYLDEHGILDDEGKPRPSAEFMLRLETRAEKLRARLGLDPLSMASLIRLLTDAPGTDDDALDKLKAEGRAIIEAREGTS